MKLIYSGKTKDVYQTEEGKIVLKFKDDVTGENGVFDPGANTVGLTMEGAGRAGLKLTTLFFRELNKKGIPTHFIDSNIEEATMKVVPATHFGEGLEVICRYKAVGSFLRRYGKYATEGQALDGFVEVTLKDDERKDPPISEDALKMLGILTEEEYQVIKSLTVKIAEMVKEALKEREIELYDIKLEFGKDPDGNIMLIDEISGGNMRAYREDQYISPMELQKIMVSS
ncbi:phosphoribosylaminoimidazolesuccinocarboxamide synthase [Virgibacillus sp. SK37]|uniref:phosphoribosylaminoimidazolesuccinocarboxamide synthase n=1 Tax=Virgibacillus sp. SK37 TaxID=403957 RepID=UPI0004D1F340|nr:phosphoribosylaminoimidazolesuccinocarboxamide synthase [Virgibacillus sp. SK37]AIF44857.1 phosphoribosylaminoimidazole-succinocarboxamide synthase [Virgibacillus sp. SK37]